MKRSFFVHRLVYKAFVGDFVDGMVIEHLDSNPENNHYSNLKQSTQKENISTAIKAGNFGSNDKKKFVILDTKHNKVLEFDMIKDAAEYANLPSWVNCVTKFFKRKSTRDRFKLLCCGYVQDDYVELEEVA